LTLKVNQVTWHTSTYTYQKFIQIGQTFCERTDGRTANRLYNVASKEELT